MITLSLLNYKTLLYDNMQLCQVFPSKSKNYYKNTLYANSIVISKFLFIFYPCSLCLFLHLYSIFTNHILPAWRGRVVYDLNKHQLILIATRDVNGTIRTSYHLAIRITIANCTTPNMCVRGILQKDTVASTIGYINIVNSTISAV
jgi:hypothetical protein